MRERLREKQGERDRKKETERKRKTKTDVNDIKLHNETYIFDNCIGNIFGDSHFEMVFVFVQLVHCMLFLFFIVGIPFFE